MGFEEAPAVWTDREPTLDEELRALGEEDIVEMANLPPDWTGVLATIFISTALGQHGPRIKVYLKPGRHQPSASISIGPHPRVLASSLDPRDLKRIAPKALAWVTLNHEALTRFWFEGDDMDIADVAAFGKGLHKV
ncbi:hypothetical protein [Brevundimonas sp.]|uniref:hypothetical protein n=1 Tax=Brevundimonas sp. TaxID=1871086 RepID=UPI002AB9D561|nr:hypothetical protein [Brevundimonas sp.]MDZ4362493.1 hypothetical protein [Brevundimonas sp.]